MDEFVIEYQVPLVMLAGAMVIVMILFVALVVVIFIHPDKKKGEDQE